MAMEEDTRQSAMLGKGSMALKVDPARQRPVAQHDANGRSSSRKFSPSAGSHSTGSTFSSLHARMYGPKATCTMTQDETRPSAPSANLCASDTMPGMGSNTLIIYTGASDHMTYDDNMFDELSRNPRDPYITSANGLPFPVTHEGHGVLAAAYLINRTPSRVLDFKTSLDVLCADTPPISVCKLPPKVFGCVAYVHVYSHQRSKLDPCALGCVFIGYSTTQKDYKCYHPPSQKVHVTLDVTFHEEVPYYVSSSSPIQEEKGSELKNFEMKNLECAEASQAICAKPTGCPEGDNWSPSTMRDNCVETTIYAKPTGRQEGDDRSPSAVETTICAKSTDPLKGHDRSPVEFLDEICPLPVECNSDIGDSCEDEIDIRPLYALPLSQSTRDDDEVLSNDVSTYPLTPRTTHGEPFINGEAVPYDPKYREEWIRKNSRANERNWRNDRP
ncbi:hypothetical protein L3X38_023204 [Prunus dulcis]|uniref:Retroviral polymerase SH3-like domain-containing protein n=1 Tax=Prunus dulcis TaxID=3755 RepID=A0AAD4VXE1_PRUDU|nr:hypothetical protein L3X38_023204 [Prunus dulcis]